MKRKLRGQPSARPVIDLTERDVLLLEAIGVFGYVSAHQLAREFFPSADRCRRRCRRLLDGKYIAVTLAGSSRNANLVSLTRDGIQALTDLRGEVAGVRMAGTIRATAVAHHLLLADARFFCWNLPNARLTGWHGGRSQMAERLGLPALHIAPDAIAELQTSRQRILFIEADCATEGVALEDKLRRYAAVLGRTPEVELWLCAKGDPARLRAVQRMCKRSEIADFTRILPEEHLVRRPCLGPPPVVSRLEGFDDL